jgi:hypothetical protein
MLIIAETKTDNSFPDAQFKIDNYHFCRADRNAHGGGLIVYVRSDLACDRKNKLECKTIESIMVNIKLCVWEGVINYGFSNDEHINCVGC